LKFFLIFCLFLFASSNVFAETRILTSIRPLALLAQDLASASDEVIQLLPVNFSPHHYQLKPSDRNEIELADLILWVGPELETSLSKLLSKSSERILTISHIKTIHWPETETDHAHHHGDHHHLRDPHVWLDPRNLMVIAEELTKILSERSPEKAETYQQNNLKLQKRLQEVDKTLTTKLQGLNDKAFIVSHPAYMHFVERYGLKQQDFIVKTPERGLGAKHLYELRQLNNVKCVFGEAGQSQRFVDQIAKHLDVNKGLLDPLGVNLPEDAKTEDIVVSLAAQVVGCLEK
jgi:zinc transport system substrate-binding protein